MRNLFKKATDPYQYDNVEANWQKYGIGLQNPTRANFWEYLKPLSSTWRGKNILDIGSGTGWLMKLALEQGAKSVLGIDPSRKNVELGRKLYPDVKLLEITLEEFKSQCQYDISVALLSLVHIGDIEAGFKKIAQVLKSDGELIVIVPDYDYSRKDRFDYKIAVEEVDNDEYIAIIERPGTTIVSIIRTTEKYTTFASRSGFTLIENKPLFPTGLLMQKNPRYRKMSSVAIAQLLRFRK